ncbi:MAG TPA: hypothetical protein VNI54_06140 [Thermoanaerobaculia bacterium]|nr:hypothetical protein [Thermoanaerobaculia bacterium]
MNKWAVRIFGLVLLLLFALVFAQLRASLTKLQREQQEQRAR